MDQDNELSDFLPVGVLKTSSTVVCDREITVAFCLQALKDGTRVLPVTDELELRSWLLRCSEGVKTSLTSLGFRVITVALDCFWPILKGVIDVLLSRI